MESKPLHSRAQKLTCLTSRSFASVFYIGYGGESCKPALKEFRLAVCKGLGEGEVGLVQGGVQESVELMYKEEAKAPGVCWHPAILSWIITEIATWKLILRSSRCTRMWAVICRAAINRNCTVSFSHSLAL